MVKQLKFLYNASINELDDVLKTVLESTDIQSMVETLLNANATDMIEDIPVTDAIHMLITVAQYVETDTTMESIMIDDDYDKLQTKYEQATGKFITGTNGTSNSNRPVAQHKYPELRGSLDKVHFVYNSEIPTKDSRKSLEYWFNTAIKKCYAKEVNPNTLYISNYYKFDGVSGVFECKENHIDQILTRKDTDSNTGTVVTHLFKDKCVQDVFNDTVPEEVFLQSDYGIKTEIMMKYNDFEEFKKLFLNDPPKNHRSAASMVVNTLAEELNPDWVDYLTIEPVQISCVEKMSTTRPDWHFIGMENDRYQYIRSSTMTQCIHLDVDQDIYDFLDHFCAVTIAMYYADSENECIPIDGIVLTILNEYVANLLGRSDNKNKYQVAYKFAAGIKKSKITKVTFPVGPVSGLVTPLVEFEPVKIMGNTITTATLSNIDKFERMHIHIGDEIMVKYNIVPTIYKTDDCKEMDTEEVKYPTNCPVCNEELTIKVHEDSGNRTVRCMNPDCPCHVAGKIYNYVNKVKIMGIGLNTIEDLISLGVLETIGDLYRIQNHEFRIKSAPGYGETKYSNLLKSINSRLVLYPHEVLGGIGIPDVGRRMMKKVCAQIPMHELLSYDESIINRLIRIDGIGEKTAIKICEGLLQNRHIIDDILRYVTIKEYEKEKESNFKVLFSKVRDAEFEKLLEWKYDAEIQNSYTKETSLLIVPDLSVTSSKIEKARKNGTRIISLEQAKEEFK